MTVLDVLALLFRWLHVLAAITAVGGTIFARVVVIPALDPLPAPDRAALHAALRARWSKVVAIAIGFLLLSGLYNIGATSMLYKLPRWYMPLFVVKFVLALGIFMIASLLSGSSPASDQMRKKLRMWLNLNIALAISVVCISGVLRTADKIPKEKLAPPPAVEGRDATG